MEDKVLTWWHVSYKVLFGNQTGRIGHWNVSTEEIFFPKRIIDSIRQEEERGDKNRLCVITAISNLGRATEKQWRGE